MLLICTLVIEQVIGNIFHSQHAPAWMKHVTAHKTIKYMAQVPTASYSCSLKYISYYLGFTLVCIIS